MQLTFPESILMRKIPSTCRADLPVSSLLFWSLQNINCSKATAGWLGTKSASPAQLSCNSP